MIDGYTGPTIPSRRPPPGEAFIPRKDANANAARAFRYGMVTGAIVLSIGLLLGAMT